MAAIWRLCALCILLLPVCACRPPAWHWPAPAAAGTTALDHPPAGDLRAAYASLPGTRLGEIPVRPLLANTEAWTARWRLLAEAQEGIDVGYFILTQDLFGMAFLGHLEQKAQQGVAVRLLIDAMGRAMGDLPGEDDCLPALLDVPGVEVRVYRPLKDRVLTALMTLNPITAAASNHDKIVVVDGRVGLIGGRNIAAKYFADPADLPSAFHDLDLILDGPAAAAGLTAAFERIYGSGQARPVERLPEAQRARCLLEMRRAYTLMDAWVRASPDDPVPAMTGAGAERRHWRRELERFQRLRGALRRPPPSTVRAPVILLDSPPRATPRPDPISAALYALLRGSSREAVIASPYLVLTEAAAEAFRAAGARGVAIRVLTNSPVSTDNPLSQQLFLEQWPGLMAHVPNLEIFASGTERNVHTKLAVFDGELVLTGAYNLDPISLDLNGEIAVAILSPQLARRLGAQPRGLIDAGPPAVYQYRIQRTAQGWPVQGPDGEPRIAFGPRDHSDPADWPGTPILWRLLSLGASWPGAPKVFGHP